MRTSRFSLDRLATTPLGVVTVALAVLLSVLCVTGGIRAPFKPTSRDVHVDFARAPQLYKGDEVRIDGDIDGRVKSLTAAADGRSVQAVLAVRKDAGPIYADATAAIQARTLLAGSFSVKLDRGSPGAGPLGGAAIPIAHTAQPVEIEDFTDIFRGGAVTGLTTLPRELGTALKDPAAPARAMKTLARVAPEATAGLDALRGEARDADLRAVVANTASTVGQLDAPRDELHTLVSGAAATLEATGHRRDAIAATLRQGPGAASDVRVTLARLDTTLGKADMLVGKLQDPAGDVAPTLSELHPAVSQTTELLHRARPLVRILRPTVTALVGAGRQGVPLVDQTKPGLQRIDTSLFPALAKPDPVTTKSTTVMIGGFFAGFGGSGAQQDTNGHFIRFPATAGLTSVDLPCESSLTDGRTDKVLACKSIAASLSSLMSYFPVLSSSPTGSNP